MVAITVALGTVVGITVFDIGTQVENSNTANVGVTTDQTGTTTRITLNSGQIESFDYIYVNTTANTTYTSNLPPDTPTSPNGPTNPNQYLYISNNTTTTTTINTPLTT